MNQPTATLIAAIVTALGSTIVGTAAVLFAWRQNAKTLIQQRQMALDERLGDRRIELYLGILEILLARSASGAEGDGLRGLLPKVVAFASEDVQQHVERLLAADVAHQSEAPTADYDIDLHREAVITIIRAELLPARVQRPLTPRPRQASK